MVFFAYSSQAAEDIYLKGEKGHFRLEPGKVYHWDWQGVTITPEKTGLPEKTVVPSPDKMKTAPLAPETPPPAKETTPKAVPKNANISKDNAPAITKGAVSLMISEIDNAANRKDIDSIAHYLAPELMVLLTVDSPDGRQDLRLNKREYLDRFQQEFSSPKYHYKSYNVEIFISQNGQSGTVVKDIRETVGANTDIMFNQKAAIELRNGQIVVTKIVSTQK